jgi:hypothetical protein
METRPGAGRVFRRSPALLRSTLPCPVTVRAASAPRTVPQAAEGAFIGPQAAACRTHCPGMPFPAAGKAVQRLSGPGRLPTSGGRAERARELLWPLAEN